ncbi:MAG: hypothetical protein E7646_06700 [Ruminococcaceae bacterium]|nr:hypothetical protein [Oscillospiraceae bacterium]
MSKEPLCLKRLYIKDYKSIKELSLEPDEHLCSVEVQSLDAAEAICEFIVSALYDDEFPEGCISLRQGENEISVIYENDERTVNNVGFELHHSTVGKSLTGLDRELFCQFFVNKIIEGSPQTVSPAVLDFCLKDYDINDGIMDNIESLDEKKRLYTNPQGNGKSDLAIKRYKDLNHRILEEESLVSQKTRLKRDIEAYSQRLDENSKRCVILKADMNNYSDDLKLCENKENAASLKNEISANEKKLRILKYEAEHEVALPPRKELEDIKRVYSEYSRFSAQLCDGQNRLMSAKDNLEYHKRLFDHADFDAASVLREYTKINSNRKFRHGFLFAAALLALTALIVFIYLGAYTQMSFLFCILVGASVFIGALIMFTISELFSQSTRQILAKLNIKTKKDFDSLHDKLNAHRKTEDVYSEQIEKCEKQCQIYSRLADTCTEKLKGLLSYTGKEIKSTAQLCHFCDRIITNSEAIAELEDQLDTQKQNYTRILSADVNKSDLTVSNEFMALERELDFIQRQSASLLAKKTAAEKKCEDLDVELKKIEEMKSQITACEQEIERLSGEYNSICALQKPLLKQVAAIKEDFSARICPAADKLLRNIRKPDEHFQLSERLLPIMVCNSIVTCPEKDQSYMGRTAMLVYKLLISMEYLKSCPMFFVDGFNFTDQKTSLEITEKLSACGYQPIDLCTADIHSEKELDHE